MATRKRSSSKKESSSMFPFITVLELGVLLAILSLIFGTAFLLLSP